MIARPLVVCLFVVRATGSIASHGTQWREITSADANLNSDWAPLLELGTHYARHDRNDYFIELASYAPKSFAARWPRAELLLVWLTSRAWFFNDANEDASGERIRQFFPDDAIDLNRISSAR